MRDTVFVVYGRNDRARKALFQFLQALRLDPIEWPRAVTEVGATPYTGEVVRKGLSESCATIVLFTGDDEVRLRESLYSPNESETEKTQQYQPRPNVMFEAGVALGLAPERVVLLQVTLPGTSLKLPSDLDGRHILKMNDSMEARNELVHRLEKSGCKPDTSGNDWQKAGRFSNAVRFGATADETYNFYDEYLTRWKRFCLVSTGTMLQCADLPVDKCKHGTRDCIVAEPDDDAKVIVKEIRRRMKSLKKNELPVAVIVESLETHKLAGIVTPSDLPRKFEKYSVSGTVKVSDIWTPDPYVIPRTWTLKEAADFIEKMKIKTGFPVVDEAKRFVGFLTPPAVEFVGGSASSATA